MFYPYGVLAMAVLWTAQGTPLDGTWLLTRIFRAGTPARPASTRAVPLDSTVYLRLSLESHTGGWFTGRLYRRYFGQPERTKLGGGPLRGTGRWILGADFDHPVSQEAKTAAWLVGDTLRLGTPFVPDADSLEFRRAVPDAPDPTTVLEVVTPR